MVLIFVFLYYRFEFFLYNGLLEYLVLINKCVYIYRCFIEFINKEFLILFYG